MQFPFFNEFGQLNFLHSSQKSYVNISITLNCLCDQNIFVVIIEDQQVRSLCISIICICVFHSTPSALRRDQSRKPRHNGAPLTACARPRRQPARSDAPKTAATRVRLAHTQSRAGALAHGPADVCVIYARNQFSAA